MGNTDVTGQTCEMVKVNMICEICDKPITNEEQKELLHKGYHNQCFPKKDSGKSNSSYLTYTIDSPFYQANFTQIKSELLDLLPKITIYFDLPEDIGKEYFKNNEFEYFKKQIAESLGDNNFSIIKIIFGSLFVQLVTLGQEAKDKILSVLEKKEWDSEPIKKKFKEKVKQTLFNFDYITVKPKYIEICSSQYTQQEQEKMITDVLEKGKQLNKSNSFTSFGEINSADQILDTLSNIAQEKEMQEKTLILFDKGLEAKEVIEKSNNSIEQMQKDSIFEFRIVGLAVVDNMNSTQYLKRKSQCPNCESQILIQGTKTKHAANSASNNFITGKDNFYGIGTYFSDQFDYVTYYANEIKTLGRVPKIGETFPIVGAEVFYDTTKFKQIYDYSYYDVAPQLPTEQYLLEHIDKTVEKNGIHFIEVEGGRTQVITKNREILSRFNYTESLPKKIYIGREYVVTDKSQILPLFALTMQRVGYCIIWRDNNFLGGIHKSYLEERKKFVNELKDLNLYIETSTESALKLIWKKKYNKIILITNVGSNLEGKKYIDKARIILGFNVIVLFFASSSRHLEWIKNYPNSLFTNTSDFFEKYVMLFNKDTGNEENRLNNLKNEVEKYYHTKLQDLKEPLKYPLFNDGNNEDQHYGELDCSPFEMGLY